MKKASEDDIIADLFSLGNEDMKAMLEAEAAASSNPASPQKSSSDKVRQKKGKKREV